MKYFETENFKYYQNLVNLRFSKKKKKSFLIVTFKFLLNFLVSSKFSEIFYKISLEYLKNIQGIISKIRKNF